VKSLILADAYQSPLEVVYEPKGDLYRPDFLVPSDFFVVAGCPEE
jgi:hypothetical protein